MKKQLYQVVASGGGSDVHLYEHNLILNLNNTFSRIYCTIYNNSSDPLGVLNPNWPTKGMMVTGYILASGSKSNYPQKYIFYATLGNQSTNVWYIWGQPGTESWNDSSATITTVEDRVIELF